MKLLEEFFAEEDGIGVVEIILILVILIALVLLFKNEITSIVKKAFSTIKSDSSTIIDD
ncbi:Flp1 family type IVb pilin [[Clostridium] polysaccharolyticum]|jgi:Flp pilus assembly pilin Flp|uniref:Putative Flagellin, Flp1-like, domain n=1 Tax=[Clostridium] polysaccharolyticum TaxID=29364 RepID=A0A1I0D9P6_9FIRM|nr:Flp1 family type IVb pilin [[Clostridium] polysaccharolyticum]SET28818.1 Putative Flagellin, Flp1-like, domain [[Clostridium] polysaccharolyticum]